MTAVVPMQAVGEFKELPGSESFQATTTNQELQTRVSDVALAALLYIGDIGTGDAGLTGFKFSEEHKFVYTADSKQTVERKDSSKKPRNPADFVNDLRNILRQEKYKDAQVILNCTSWARYPDNNDKETIGLLNEITQEFKNVVVNVLTQEEEAYLSKISLEHAIDHMDIGFVRSNNITKRNTIQVEAGNGSFQSVAILPKQTREIAGKWVSEKIAAGETLSQVVTGLRYVLANEFKPELPGIKNIGIQGSLAVGLSLYRKETKDITAADRVLAKALGINVDNKIETTSWDTGQMIRPLAQIIAALKERINFFDDNVNRVYDRLLINSKVRNLLYPDDGKTDSSKDREVLHAFAKGLKRTDKKLESGEAALLKPLFDVWTSVEKNAVPTVLALATLEAIREKYGAEFDCFVLKEAMTLHGVNGKVATYKDSDGKAQSYKYKVSGSTGAAVQYYLKPEDTITRMGKIANTHIGSANTPSVQLSFFA